MHIGAVRRGALRATVPLVGALAMLAVAAVNVDRAGADTYPVVYSVTAALGGANPNTPPPGANDWNCHPSQAHPRPVVLVHATFANQNSNWATLSPLLANNGYCVFTFNYGGPPLLGIAYGRGDIASGAAELAGFVDQVLSATGSATVDLVGHSQGGMMPNYYLKFLDGAQHVQRLVALAPSNHGTSAAGLLTLASLFPGVLPLTDGLLGAVCQSCVEQERGSAFLSNLNAGGDTVPGVSYTVIATRYDEVVTPYYSQFLSGPDVNNITIQDQCPFDFDGHLGMAFDHIALQDVLNALDPSSASDPVCTFVPFDLGG